MSRVGVLALARPTFDVEYATEVAETAFKVLDEVTPGFVSTRQLLFDAAATEEALSQFQAIDIDALIILQITFTDASMTKVVAAAVDAPLIFWSFPEARTGGRLRLNSLCGINLAAYALRRDGHEPAYLYSRADDPQAADQMRHLLTGGTSMVATERSQSEPPSEAAMASATQVAESLRGLTAGIIGAHPDGFDPCSYDAAEVKALTGINVQRVELPELFTAADAADSATVDAARTRASQSLGTLDDLDQESLDKSLRLYCGLQELATSHDWSALATRCWPECFTEYGGAACAPQGMLTNDGIPGGCEADAYGTLTSLALREIAGEPPFVADLVDIDLVGDTAVFWHCGVAPMHMADPETAAGPTVHSNRRKPLLHEFPLKPGRVTIARLSQAGGRHQLVVGGGEMLRADLPFSGTAGVMRFDRSAAEVLATVLTEGLEHHYGIAYGDHREVLRALARHWGIPVVELT